MWTHENDWPSHLISAPPPLLCRFEIYPLRKVNLLSPCSRKEDQSAETLPPSGFVKDQRHLVAPSETASKDPTHSLKFPRPSLGDWRGGGGVNKNWNDLMCSVDLACDPCEENISQTHTDDIKCSVTRSEQCFWYVSCCFDLALYLKQMGITGPEWHCIIATQGSKLWLTGCQFDQKLSTGN